MYVCMYVCIYTYYVLLLCLFSVYGILVSTCVYIYIYIYNIYIHAVPPEAPPRP